MESIVKVMKYEIVCPVNSDWDTMGKYLRDVQYAVWKTSNISIQMMWDYQNFSFGYKTRFGKSLKFSDLGTGKSQSSDMYKKAIDDFPYASSSSLNMAVQKAGIRFNKMKPDILKGAVSIPSFKKDIPIPIRAPRTYITKEAGDYLIKFALLSQSFAKENGVPVNYIVKTRTKSAGKAILDRIISGEYTLCDSEILRKGRKWYVCVAYKFTPEQRRLSKENVAGVDVGIANAAVVAVNSGWDRLYIEGGEINAFRKRVEHRRKQLLRQGKYCGNGRRGRGRKTKLRPIETISEKAANFRKTTNHKYARAIVNFALKNSCGVIQMEDLSSISEKKSADRKSVV